MSERMTRREKVGKKVEKEERRGTTQSASGADGRKSRKRITVKQPR